VEAADWGTENFGVDGGSKFFMIVERDSSFRSASFRMTICCKNKITPKDVFGVLFFKTDLKINLFF
jgi:hypothetical protein